MLQNCFNDMTDRRGMYINTRNNFNSKFKWAWRWKYFFTEFSSFIIYLILLKTTSILHLYNIFFNNFFKEKTSFLYFWGNTIAFRRTSSVQDLQRDPFLKFLPEIVVFYQIKWWTIVSIWTVEVISYVPIRISLPNSNEIFLKGALPKYCLFNLKQFQTAYQTTSNT